MFAPHNFFSCLFVLFEQRTSVCVRISKLFMYLLKVNVKQKDCEKDGDYSTLINIGVFHTLLWRNNNLTKYL